MDADLSAAETVPMPPTEWPDGYECLLAVHSRTTFCNQPPLLVTQALRPEFG